MRHMRKVYSTDNIAIIGHARQVLENHAIPCVVRNDFLLGGAGELPVNGLRRRRFEGDARDFDRARTLVDGIVAAARECGPPWRCASCGEQMEGQFTDCWCCGASRPDTAG